MSEIKLIDITTGREVAAVLETRKKVLGLFQAASIIERKPGQLVHLREDEANSTCAACGAHAAIWLDGENRHKRHPARCTAVTEALQAAAA